MFRFDNTYARLPERFYARVSPTRVVEPRIVKVNLALADALGADGAALESPQGAQVLAGNVIPEGAEPIALAYAGHQFGSFVPQLGDGRAILLGEVVGKDGARRDIQLKGAGRTPFSRGGDGRAALGPVLREYVVSEAMAALGIPTTRALAAVTTGEVLERDGRCREPCSRASRRATSGSAPSSTSPRATTRTRSPRWRRTPWRATTRSAAGSGNDALALLERVIAAQASLVARWLGVGFIHGVMNTDNTSISGETIDYGPCAFLDTYDPRKKFSSIDTAGRYAFANQPRIAHWNVTRLAEALLPLLADDEDEAVRRAQGRLERFPALFDAAHLARAPRQAGARRAGARTTRGIARSPVTSSSASRRTRWTTRCSFGACARPPRRPAPTPGRQRSSRTRARSSTGQCAGAQRLSREDVEPGARASAMRRVNPAFIPRNHRVEEVIVAAVAHGDYVPFETLLEVVTRPYDDRADRPELARFAEPPKPEERVLETFCGT